MTLERRRGFREDHKDFGMHIRSEVAREPAMQIGREIAKYASATATIQKDDPLKPRESKKRRRRRSIKASGYRARPDGNLRVGRNTRAIAVVEIINPNAPFDEGGNKYFRGNRTLLKAAQVVSVRKLGRFDGEGPRS